MVESLQHCKLGIREKITCKEKFIMVVGIPGTFDICQEIVKPGGYIANVGVHGKPVEFHIEKLYQIPVLFRQVDRLNLPAV